MAYGLEDVRVCTRSQAPGHQIRVLEIDDGTLVHSSQLSWQLRWILKKHENTSIVLVSRQRLAQLNGVEHSHR